MAEKKTTPTMSVADQLKQHQEAIADLRNQRIHELKEQIEGRTSELNTLEAELNQLEFEANPLMIQPTKGKRGAKISVAGGTGRKSAKHYIVEALQTHRAGLSLAGLGEAVKKAGYHSDSANFQNVLYQTVRKIESVEHDKANGVYKLVK